MFFFGFVVKLANNAGQIFRESDKCDGSVRILGDCVRSNPLCGEEMLLLQFS